MSIGSANQKPLFWVVVIVVVSFVDISISFYEHATTTQYTEESSSTTATTTSIKNESRHRSPMMMASPSVQSSTSNYKYNSSSPALFSTSSSLSSYQDTNKGSSVVADFSSIIRDGQVVGNVSFLLDFAIVGFSKCGTSSVSAWLRRHPSVQIPKQEMRNLKNSILPIYFVRDLYERYRAEPMHVRGYKSPIELYQYRGLVVLRKYFPRTKMIVGVRHPISWFESFHNFRTFAGRWIPFDEDRLLTMSCGLDLCVQHAKFHYYLYSLGVTPGNTPAENELLGPAPPRPRILLHNDGGNGAASQSISGSKVFLYEISQLSRRPEVLAGDLGRFLELKDPPLMPPPANDSDARFANSGANRPRAFDICQERYDRLRHKLLEIAVNASLWMRTYFLSSPNVVVSSRGDLERILVDWNRDPCDDEKKKKNTTMTTRRRA